MALDYSTLSDQELEAIANDDYSKLSDATLQALTGEGPGAQTGKTLGEYSFGEVGQAAGNLAGAVAGTGLDAATAAYRAIPYKELVIPYAGLKAAPHIYEGAKQGARVLSNFVTGQTPPAPPAPPQQMSLPNQGASVASRLLPMAPAAMLGAPYALAGLEAANIRRNPNAPGYANVPYAQMYRGEAPTQNIAGEANRMRALSTMPFGNVTPQERAMLEEDMRMRQAVRRKAFEKVMGPVAPGSF